MKFLIKIFSMLFLFHSSVNAETLEQKITIGKHKLVTVSIYNYHDNKEPICVLKMVAENKKLTKYMFDSCGNFTLNKLNESLLKVEVINNRGNREKIIYFNSELSLLGTLELSDETIEIIDNNFNNQILFGNLNSLDSKLLKLFLIKKN